MRNILKTAFAVSLLALTVSVPQKANAVVTYDLQDGNNNVVTVNADQQVLFYAPKSGSYEAVQFSIPSLNITQNVPAVFQDTYFFDASQYPASEINFVIKTADGSQQIATGKIINNYAVTETTSFKSLTEYSTAYKYEKKTEPVYTSSKDAPAIYYVRGNW